MGKTPEQTFFQRRHTDDQQTHEKMFNIANYQRNANQDNIEISHHSSQNGYHQEIDKQVLERMWREGNPPSLLLQIVAATMENSMEVPQKTKNRPSI